MAQTTLEASLSNNRERRLVQWSLCLWQDQDASQPYLNDLNKRVEKRFWLCVRSRETRRAGETYFFAFFVCTCICVMCVEFGKGQLKGRRRGPAGAGAAGVLFAKVRLGSISTHRVISKDSRLERWRPEIRRRKREKRSKAPSSGTDFSPKSKHLRIRDLSLADCDANAIFDFSNLQFRRD